MKTYDVSDILEYERFVDKLRSENKQLKEAFDRKTAIHNRLNRDYTAIQEEKKTLMMAHDSLTKENATLKNQLILLKEENARLRELLNLADIPTRPEVSI